MDFKSQLKAARLETPTLTIKQAESLFNTVDKDIVRKTFRKVTKELIIEKKEQELQEKLAQEKKEEAMVHNMDQLEVRSDSTEGFNGSTLTNDTHVAISEPAKPSTVDPHVEQDKRNAALSSYNRNKIDKEMPQLYPGPPKWLNSNYKVPKELEWHINYLKSTNSQRESDKRWNYVVYVYGESTTQQRTFEQHCELFLKAGYKLVPTCYYGNELLTFQDLMASSPQMELIYPFTFPKGLVYTQCYTCKTPTINECLCGEHYCSVPCQVYNYKNHKELCEMVQENNLMYCKVTEGLWENYFREHPREKIIRKTKYK